MQYGGPCLFVLPIDKSVMSYMILVHLLELTHFWILNEYSWLDSSNNIESVMELAFPVYE